MFRFTIFGIPVEIQPMFWLTGALLGGAYAARTREEIIAVVVFMIVAAISIIVHELGHAIVGRRVGGGRASIVLWGLGGLAYNQGGRFTRWGRFWMIAAGPGAGFLLGLLVVALLILWLGFKDGLSLTTFHLFRFTVFEPSANLAQLWSEKPQQQMIIHSFLYINFWWGVINLLPVIPLDGGRIMEIFVTPQKRVYQIGIFVGIAMVIFSVTKTNSIYTAMMFGFLAFQNWQSMQQDRWR